jgi:hypothetical protein
VREEGKIGGDWGKLNVAIEVGGFRFPHRTSPGAHRPWERATRDPYTLIFSTTVSPSPNVHQCSSNALKRSPAFIEIF